MNLKNTITNLKQKLPASCKLIAVSKTQPVSLIKEAYDAGQRVFGENKVQELVEKYEALPSDIEWHLIGHLQTNKVKYIAPFVSLIHGVDSFKLLQEIDKQGKKINRVVPCLLQVFIASEETKFGFLRDEVLALLESNAIRSLHHVSVEGLMGMASFTDDKEKVRREFKDLKNFFEELKKRPSPPNMHLKQLSMGMSGDYEIAIEEGSTMVRIGTAIFGARNKAHVNG